MRAVAIGLVREGVLFDGETERRGDPDQLGEDAQWVIAGQARTGLGQRVTLGLGKVKHRHGAEAGDHAGALLGIIVGVHAPGHGRQDPDGVLAVADLPAKPAPGLETCHA